MQTLHALNRITGRLSQAGVNIDAIAKQVEFVAGAYPSMALLVWSFPRMYNDSSRPYRDREESNGDQLWAICRNRKVVTWMFRRSNQPATKAALQVERVCKLRLLAA